MKTGQLMVIRLVSGAVQQDVDIELPWGRIGYPVMSGIFYRFPKRFPCEDAIVKSMIWRLRGDGVIRPV